MVKVSTALSNFLPARISYALNVLKNGVPVDHLQNATYDQDGLKTIHNADFMRDETFLNAYRAGEKLDSWFGAKIHWRAHVVLWAATRGMGLDGDFVECGVHRGGFSRAVIEYTDFGRNIDKHFYLLDTYDGLNEGLVSIEEKQNGILDYPYKSNYDEVKEAFSKFANVIIIKGIIPDTLSQVPSKKVAFLSIDLNCAEPEIAAAEFFWDKLVPGAVVVLDDYGWAKHIVQKHAFDDFASRKKVQILSLPTGQGIIIKP